MYFSLGPISWNKHRALKSMATSRNRRYSSGKSRNINPPSSSTLPEKKMYRGME